MEKTAHRYGENSSPFNSREHVFCSRENGSPLLRKWLTVIEKTANRLFTENDLLTFWNKTARRFIEKMANRLFPERRQLEKTVSNIEISIVN